jgi:hypothetical protein
VGPAPAAPCAGSPSAQYRPVRGPVRAASHRSVRVPAASRSRPGDLPRGFGQKVQAPRIDQISCQVRGTPRGTGVPPPVTRTFLLRRLAWTVRAASGDLPRRFLQAVVTSLRPRAADGPTPPVRLQAGTRRAGRRTGSGLPGRAGLVGPTRMATGGCCCAGGRGGTRLRDSLGRPAGHPPRRAAASRRQMDRPGPPGRAQRAGRTGWIRGAPLNGKKLSVSM